MITADGLVGRIEEVSLNSSKVMAIIDARAAFRPLWSVRVSRRSSRARSRAIPSTIPCITFLPLDADITEGDKIITSGLDGVYPKGFLIGEVASSSDTEAEGKNVRIEPAVDFRRLEEVFVVTAVDGEETGTISAANEVIGSAAVGETAPCLRPRSLRTQRSRRSSAMRYVVFILMGVIGTILSGTVSAHHSTFAGLGIQIDLVLLLVLALVLDEKILRLLFCSGGGAFDGYDVFHDARHVRAVLHGRCGGCKHRGAQDGKIQFAPYLPDWGWAVMLSRSW